MARIGILGGTFNPPHIGHLVCAQEAYVQLELDQVLLMPVASPPHKPLPDDPGAEHRLAMCRLAAGDDARLAVSDLEIERGGASYTVATLEELHARHPEDDLTFIVGGDMAASLPQWREPERVLELARFGVAEREHAERDVIAANTAGLHGKERIVFFDMPRVDVSSSMIRHRVAEGRPVQYLVPDAVADYIDARGLYASAVTA